tara:strand:- start:303 stop:893 length:591 start_codon:yes stop_codon:yes gene_type:complete
MGGFSKSRTIADFIYGQMIQCAVINAFTHGLKYTSYSSGMENRYPISDKLRLISQKSNDLETIKNIERIRMEPDTLLLSPEGKFAQVEIKSRRFRCFNEFMRSNFNNNEINKVMRYYPSVRFLYVDLSSRRISSIFSDDPMTEVAQYNNWYHPESWIDGINNRAELLAWQEEYIFAPLMIQSEKTISRLGNEIYET